MTDNRKRCERWGSSSPSQDSSPYAMLDYCAERSRDLCNACMAKGCCGHVPAISGTKEGGGDE